MSATTPPGFPESPRDFLANWTASRGNLRNFLETQALAPLDEEDAEGTEHPELKRRIAALYASFMDDETVEARGLEPIASDLAAVATVSTPAELLALSGRLQRQGVSGLINTGALNDAGNPDRMLLHLLQGGLGLPDESYYRDEAYAEILEQYTEHTGRLLALAGIGADRDEAAALGVWLHAGAGQRLGELGRGLAASDLIPTIRQLLEEHAPCLK